MSRTRRLRELFEQMDTNRSGTLTLANILLSWDTRDSAYDGMREAHLTDISPHFIWRLLHRCRQTRQQHGVVIILWLPLELHLPLADDSVCEQVVIRLGPLHTPTSLEHGGESTLALQ